MEHGLLVQSSTGACIKLVRKQQPTIGMLNSDVQICVAEDVITDGELQLKRKAKIKGWAYIVNSLASTFSTGGHTTFQERDKRTHKIWMRYMDDLNVSTAAWIYEDRGTSSPRWYKILGIIEVHKGNHWFVFDCRLVSRGDNIAVPIKELFSDGEELLGGPQPLPDGVVL